MSGHRMSCTIETVAEKKRKKHVSGNGPDAIFTDISLGWFVTLAEVPTSIYVGLAKPDYEKGDKVWLVIQKQ